MYTLLSSLPLSEPIGSPPKVIKREHFDDVAKNHHNSDLNIDHNHNKKLSEKEVIDVTGDDDDVCEYMTSDDKLLFEEYPPLSPSSSSVSLLTAIPSITPTTITHNIVIPMKPSSSSSSSSSPSLSDSVFLSGDQFARSWDDVAHKIGQGNDLCIDKPQSSSTKTSDTKLLSIDFSDNDNDNDTELDANAAALCIPKYHAMRTEIMDKFAEAKQIVKNATIKSKHNEWKTSLKSINNKIFELVQAQPGSKYVEGGLAYIIKEVIRPQRRTLDYASIQLLLTQYFIHANFFGGDPKTAQLSAEHAIKFMCQSIPANVGEKLTCVDFNKPAAPRKRPRFSGTIQQLSASTASGNKRAKFGTAVSSGHGDDSGGSGSGRRYTRD